MSSLLKRGYSLSRGRSTSVIANDSQQRVSELKTDLPPPYSGPTYSGTADTSGTSAGSLDKAIVFVRSTSVTADTLPLGKEDAEVCIDEATVQAH